MFISEMEEDMSTKEKILDAASEQIRIISVSFLLMGIITGKALEPECFVIC